MTPDATTCGACAHFWPHINPRTHRVCPSKSGRCGWSPEIVWPMAYRGGYGFRAQDPTFHSTPVFRHTSATTCRCFAPKSPAPEPPAPANAELAL